MNKVIFASITITLVLLDQFTKLLVIKQLAYKSIILINGVLYLTFTKNTGAVFGILRNQNSILIWLSVIVIGFILYYISQIPDTKLYLVVLILGGAIGNLIDRVRLGYVIDFIDFRFWPTFNIADSAITVGVIGLVISNLVSGGLYRLTTRKNI